MKITASQLFAAEMHRHGDQVCFYCSASCDETHKTKTYVKPTFTNRDIVKCPNSTYVCQGCVMSLSNGFDDITFIDGTIRYFTKPSIALAPRMYSWILTANKKIAFTKAHVSQIRDILTDMVMLPEPPFAIIISDSGQKQLVFRAPVAYEKENFSILLEDEVVNINVDNLKKRVELANQISTKIGKPALKCDPEMSHFIAAKKVGVHRQLEYWQHKKHEPLSRLAAWLAKSKEK